MEIDRQHRLLKYYCIISMLTSYKHRCNNACYTRLLTITYVHKESQPYAAGQRFKMHLCWYCHHYGPFRKPKAMCHFHYAVCSNINHYCMFGCTHFAPPLTHTPRSDCLWLSSFCICFFSILTKSLWHILMKPPT